MSNNLSLVQGPCGNLWFQYKSLDGAHHRKSGLANVAIPLP